MKDIKVVCDQAYSNPWACLHCVHSKAHEPISRREATRVELPCHEHGDWCIETHQRVKCIRVM